MNNSDTHVEGSDITFSELGLHENIVRTLTELEHFTPTPIQAAVIPVLLAGGDVIGRAQTGTGKTAAFALPILQNLDASATGIQALVVVPTRELAIQVTEAVDSYGGNAGTRVMTVYGGQRYEKQIGRLKRGVDIVVGTPGRLIDLLKRRVLDLQGVTTVILDEADEMLSMGFIEDIETILEKTPDVRQTALFSATMPQRISLLAERYLQDPELRSTGPSRMTVDAIDQRYYLVNEEDKLAVLTRLLEAEDASSSLIFVRTRTATGELANELTNRGFPAEALNGDMSQGLREQTLKRFRDNQIKMLVATDVAARGLDINDISHVINYDIPLEPELYVHRIGRTGRAGKTGVAITLLTPDFRRRLRAIEDYARIRITRAVPPTEEEIKTQRDERLLEQMRMWLRRGRCNRERLMLEQFTEAGHDPLEIAAAALKIARAEEKQRPIDPISEVREPRPVRDPRARNERFRRGGNRGFPTPRKRDSNMVRLALSKGRTHGIRVNQVVGTIAGCTGIPGHVLGRIRIEDQQSFVDVPQALAELVLSRTRSFRIGAHSVSVSRA